MPTPSEGMFKAANRFHRAIFNLTKGRVMGRLMGMPVLDLITTGAKSGEKRSSMLTAPIQNGESLVIVGSRGGDSTKHPGWIHNIRKNPDVEVIMRGGRKQMRGRIATSDERAALWPQVVAAYKGYAGYQKDNPREIPLVILEPR